MTNREILKGARHWIAAKRGGAEMLPQIDASASRYDRFCIEVASFVLRGVPYFFHCKSPQMLQQARAFADANGWPVTIEEDYGDGHGAVSIGPMAEVAR